jgi:hypothetical protein
MGGFGQLSQKPRSWPLSPHVQGGGRQDLGDLEHAGKNNFIGRAVCLFMDMDKMVGGEFEKGLNQLKSIVEA